MSGAALAVRIEVEPDFRWTVPCGFLVDPVPRGMAGVGRLPAPQETGSPSRARALAGPRKFVLPRLPALTFPLALPAFARFRMGLSARQFLVMQLAAGFLAGFVLAFAAERAGMTNIWQSTGLAPALEAGSPATD